MLNTVILMGRLTRDPDYKQTASGISVCKFSIAVDRRFKNKETDKYDCDFIDCQAWRGTADFISRYFSKGSMIAVEGSIQNNNWIDNEGKKHYSNIVQIEQAHFCGGKNESGNTAQTQTADSDVEAFAQAINAEVVTGQEVPF